MILWRFVSQVSAQCRRARWLIPHWFLWISDCGYQATRSTTCPGLPVLVPPLPGPPVAGARSFPRVWPETAAPIRHPDRPASSISSPLRARSRHKAKSRSVFSFTANLMESLMLWSSKFDFPSPMLTQHRSFLDRNTCESMGFYVRLNFSLTKSAWILIKLGTCTYAPLYMTHIWSMWPKIKLNKQRSQNGSFVKIIILCWLRD